MKRDRIPEFSSDVRSRMRRIWSGIKQRCDNPKHIGYQYYGARGITMCDRWRNSLDAFIADMGMRPSHQHSIDRYPDTDGNYEPGNCRWATLKEQRRNFKRYKVSGQTAFGRTQTFDEWAAEFGIKRNTLVTRINRGWTLEQALTEKRRTKLVNVVLAPKKPTDAMLDAGGAAYRRCLSGVWEQDRQPDEMLCAYVYRAMLEAAN